jgi:hypothetical protein
MFDLFTRSGDCYNFSQAETLVQEIDVVISQGKSTSTREDILATLIALYLLIETFDSR